jgi:hypothetical protein
MRYYSALLALCVLLFAESFPASEVAILGDIDYGRKSDALTCSENQRFCALVFNGMSGDRVQVAVTGGQDKPFVAIADGGLNELARGTGEVSLKLPKVTDDLATYYIVFRDNKGKSGQFTVELKKLE